jgi:hypothetical protein
MTSYYIHNGIDADVGNVTMMTSTMATVLADYAISGVQRVGEESDDKEKKHFTRQSNSNIKYS